MKSYNCCYNQNDKLENLILEVLLDIPDVGTNCSVDTLLQILIAVEGALPLYAGALSLLLVCLTSSSSWYWLTGDFVRLIESASAPRGKSFSSFFSLVSGV